MMNPSTIKSIVKTNMPVITHGSVGAAGLVVGGIVGVGVGLLAATGSVQALAWYLAPRLTDKIDQIIERRQRRNLSRRVAEQGFQDIPSGEEFWATNGTRRGRQIIIDGAPQGVSGGWRPTDNDEEPGTTWGPTPNTWGPSSMGAAGAWATMSPSSTQNPSA